MSRLSFLRCSSLLFLCALVAALVGCGKLGGSPAKGSDAQVAARVNESDITVHQVQQALQRLRQPSDGGEVAARRALDQLVEQELSAQAARGQGLDRDPDVVQTLEVVRREVLARAWQDRLALEAVRPSSDEIDRYYAANPALFAQRRLYMLQETFVEARDGERTQAEQVGRASRGARDLEERLNAAHLRYRARQFAQNAEDLPMALVAPMASLEPGQSLVVPVPQGVRIYTVLHAVTAPVEPRIAADAIEAFLVGERKRRAVAEGMKPVREKAAIEYRGSFARPASAPASAGG